MEAYLALSKPEEAIDMAAVALEHLPDSVGILDLLAKANKFKMELDDQRRRKMDEQVRKQNEENNIFSIIEVGCVCVCYSIKHTFANNCIILLNV